VSQSTDRAYDNDSAVCRIELNSKEVIGRSCQMLKARLGHGRIKQKRLKVWQIVESWTDLFENLRIY